ncbi:MAG: glycine cleavage system aminomethyltransferase GcvT [Acidimicrobiales bacterium]
MSNDHQPSVPEQAGQERRTPLHALHRELGAKMAPFAGWDMPMQFEGVIAEHNHCRASAGLFDVSHMTVIELWGDDPARSLERITPAGITTLAEGRQRYGLMTNPDGGVVDDFIVTNWGEHLTMIANASRRDDDLAYLTEHLTDVDIVEKPEIALIALQGPKAADIIVGHDPSLADTVFLDNRMAEIGGIQVAAGRSGYTGEDGFELAVANDDAAALAELLLVDPALKPIGLGARDTLRLEAGLCLYGNDLDATTSPVEADLVWTMPKRRREAGDFVGSERIVAELAGGPSRIRVGLQPEGRRPVRDGAELRAADPARSDSQSDQAGEPAGSTGTVSSGGFGPTVGRPVAMAYVAPDLASIGTELVADVRGNDVNCTVAELPFTPHRYRRQAR